MQLTSNFTELPFTRCGNTGLLQQVSPLLNSYVGCVGSLMAESEIVEVLNTTFTGFIKMFSGKTFTNNARTLHMLVQQLFCPVVEENPALVSWRICYVYWMTYQKTRELHNCGLIVL